MKKLLLYIGTVLFTVLAFAAEAPKTISGDLNILGNLFLKNQTASTVPYIDSSKEVQSSSTTPTELGFVHSVTSSLCGINQSCTLTNKALSGSSNTFTSIPLSTAVTGALPVGNGGTNNGSLSVAAGGVLYTDGSKVVNVGVGATGQALKSNGTSAPTWGAVAGSGTKNYLSNYTASLSSGVSNTGNGDAELGATTGFSLGHVATITNGLPSGSITFGSGASGNLSLAATQTNPLSQGWSFSYISSAATTAGDFLASDAFYIDASDQGKVLTWSFSYRLNSGTASFPGTSANSFAVGIYDVGNSAFIGSTGNFNLVQGSGVGKATGTFQANTSTTQYRLVIYDSTATSGAATMYFDDISVGPQVSPNAPAISDAKATVIVYENFGTVTANNAFTKRIGDQLAVWGTVTPGTTVAATAAIDIPTGMTIDSTKLSSSTLGQAVGTFFIGTASANAIPGTSAGPFTIFYDGSTTSKVFLASGSNSSILTKGNASGLSAGSTNPLSYYFTVPIAGWSSNSVSSSDTDTRVVAAAANTLSSTTITANTAFQFTTTSYDTAGGITTGAGYKYTASTSGYYQINFVGSTTTATASGIYVAKNGTFTITAANTLTIISSAAGASGQLIMQLNAGDTIQFAGSVSCTASTTNFNWSLSRISGPAVVTATESVSAQYTLTSNFATGTTTPINFDTKVYDSHNAVTTGASSWKFTAPVSGKYRISSNMTYGSGSGANLFIYKNAAALTYFGSIAASTATWTTPSATVSLLAGDTIDIRGASTITILGGAQSSTTAATIYIEKVGN